jgi:hypothetical protein
VDASRPGALELGGARGAGAARAEFAPRDPGRPPVVFEGAHVPSRDSCEGVLVFENGVVRLETLAGAWRCAAQRVRLLLAADVCGNTCVLLRARCSDVQELAPRGGAHCGQRHVR